MFSNTDVINIALAFDQNFIIPFYVLTNSIFDTNPQNKFVFHLIATGLKESEKNDVKNFIEKHKGEIHFYQPDEKLLEKFVIPKHTHFSIATYYRLFFPELISPEIKKLLYLDTDIVIIGDLAPLYNINIDQVPLAASVDPKINRRPELGIYEDHNYFNAGVLLINTEEWNRQQVTFKAIEFLLSFPDKIQWADQDGLNAVLIKNWKKIDNKFNITYYDIPPYLSKKEIINFLKDKTVIHFTTQHKPWLISGANRLRFLYQQQLKNLPVKTYKKYTDLDNKMNYLKFIKIKIKEFLIDFTPLFNSRKKILKPRQQQELQ